MEDQEGSDEILALFAGLSSVFDPDLPEILANDAASDIRDIIENVECPGSTPVCMQEEKRRNLEHVPSDAPELSWLLEDATADVDPCEEEFFDKMTDIGKEIRPFDAVFANCLSSPSDYSTLELAVLNIDPILSFSSGRRYSQLPNGWRERYESLGCPVLGAESYLPRQLLDNLRIRMMLEEADGTSRSGPPVGGPLLTPTVRDAEVNYGQPVQKRRTRSANLEAVALRAAGDQAHFAGTEVRVVKGRKGEIRSELIAGEAVARLMPQKTGNAGHLQPTTSVGLSSVSSRKSAGTVEAAVSHESGTEAQNASAQFYPAHGVWREAGPSSVRQELDSIANQGQKKRKAAMLGAPPTSAEIARHMSVMPSRPTVAASRISREEKAELLRRKQSDNAATPAFFRGTLATVHEVQQAGTVVHHIQIFAVQGGHSIGLGGGSGESHRITAGSSKRTKAPARRQNGGKNAKKRRGPAPGF